MLTWLHEGYPEGVPPTDYFPLLALLTRSLTEEEVVKVAQTVLKQADSDTPVTDEQIERAIRDVTEKECTPEELRIRLRPGSRPSAGRWRRCRVRHRAIAVIVLAHVGLDTVTDAYH